MPKEIVTREEVYVWIPIWQTMSVEQRVPPLDEIWGPSQLHDHGPWIVREVALSLDKSSNYLTSYICFNNFDHFSNMRFYKVTYLIADSNALQ